MENAVKMMIPIKEAVTLTGLTYCCIRRLCLENKIQHIRSGKKYYVNTDSLLQYCNTVGMSPRS